MLTTESIYFIGTWHIATDQVIDNINIFGSSFIAITKTTSLIWTLIDYLESIKLDLRRWQTSSINHPSLLNKQEFKCDLSHFTIGGWYEREDNVNHFFFVISTLIIEISLSLKFQINLLSFSFEKSRNMNWNLQKTAVDKHFDSLTRENRKRLQSAICQKIEQATLYKTY